MLDARDGESHLIRPASTQPTRASAATVDQDCLLRLLDASELDYHDGFRRYCFPGPRFVLPMTEPLAESSPATDDTVWHYMRLPRLLTWLGEKQLYLTLLELFAADDPYETSVPRGQSEAELPLLSGGEFNWMESWKDGQFQWSPIPPWEGKAIKVARLRRALLRSAHASCWQVGEESEAMWRLYAPGNDGVAIRSTLAKIQAAQRRDLRPLSPICYIDFNRDKFTFEEREVPVHLAMHKRTAFKHEHEARMLMASEVNYRKACEDPTFSLPDRIAIPWDFDGTVDEIVLSPRCPPDDQSRYTAAIASQAPELKERIRSSVLARPPSWS